MRPALAAIADDGDLLALDEVEIGVTIVIDTHFRLPSRFEDQSMMPKSVKRFSDDIMLYLFDLEPDSD
ncbi:MAG: hypothetical protein E5V61_20210, partial [Mesorhizobium sp.]